MCCMCSKTLIFRKRVPRLNHFISHCNVWLPLFFSKACNFSSINDRLLISFLHVNPKLPAFLPHLHSMWLITSVVFVWWVEFIICWQFRVSSLLCVRLKRCRPLSVLFFSSSSSLIFQLTTLTGLLSIFHLSVGADFGPAVMTTRTDGTCDQNSRVILGKCKLIESSTVSNRSVPKIL